VPILRHAIYIVGLIVFLRRGFNFSCEEGVRPSGKYDYYLI
jgi:hypothetical protein